MKKLGLLAIALLGFSIPVMARNGTVLVIDKIAPKNGAFVGVVDSSQTVTSTAAFNGNLSGADTNVQKALDTLDNLSIAASGMIPGVTYYIQVKDTLQSGSTFYVSSGTVNGPFKVSGQITAGTGPNVITTLAGLLDATKLTGLVPNASIDPSSVTKQGVLLAGSNITLTPSGGTTTIASTGGGITPNATYYVQVTDALQSGATFFVSSGTVGGGLRVSGPITIYGGTIAISTITSGLIINAGSTNTIAGDFQANSAFTNVPFIHAYATSTVMSLFTNAVSTSTTEGIIISTSIAFTGTSTTMGSCGTSPSVIGNNTTGTITVGTGGISSACTMNFANGGWKNAPKCFANDQTAIIAVQVVPGTLAVTFNAAVAFAASTLIDYWCIGRQ